MTLRCYSQRLLNPFRGVVNVIEYGSAEAVTMDGIHWDIYVTNDELIEDISDQVKVQTSDIRYGSWSPRNGLKRGPIQPSADFVYMEHQGTMVYDYLLQHYQEAPFPFIDIFELWLLDSHMQPLALLESATCSSDMELDIRLQWRAGIECNRVFSSEVMTSLEVCNRCHVRAGEYLSAYINSCAGETPAAQWFRRNPDGSGTGVAGINLPEHHASRCLSAGHFPRYFIRDSLHGHRHKRLLDDFLAWQAPWLLLLHDLDRSARKQLERLARRRATTVDKCYLLYPEYVDEAQIQAARVEAALRRHGADAGEEDEADAASFMEMHPCPSE